MTESSRPKWWGAYLEAIAGGATRAGASKAAGQEKKNTFRYLQRHADAHEEVLAAELQMLGDITSILWEIGQDPDHPKQVEVLKFLADRRLKEFKQEQPPPAPAVQINMIEGDPQGQLERLVAQIEERKAIDVESSESQ